MKLKNVYYKSLTIKGRMSKPILDTVTGRWYRLRSKYEICFSFTPRSWGLGGYVMFRKDIKKVLAILFFPFNFAITKDSIKVLYE